MCAQRVAQAGGTWIVTQRVFRGWLQLLRVLLVVAALGCSAYRAPPATPPLVASREPVRVVRAAGATARVQVVIRAGSAYDPPSREGLAFVLAQALAVSAEALVSVGPELVVFSVAPDGVPALAQALRSPLSTGAIDTGKAAALARFASPACEDLAAASASAWVLAGHPYGHAAFGRSSVIPTLSLAEIEVFRARRYARDAAVIAVGGEADVQLLTDLFTPGLSASPTPAVRSRVPMGDLVVVAPVTNSCGALGPRRLAAWDASDAAAARVAAEMAGMPAPERLVDPMPTIVLHDFAAGIGTLLEGDFAAARARVLARESAAGALPLAEDLLLSSIRMGHAVPSTAVRAALELLTDEAFDAWVSDALGEAVVRVAVLPDTASVSTVESVAGRGVVTSEALLR